VRVGRTEPLDSLEVGGVLVRGAVPAHGCVRLDDECMTPRFKGRCYLPSIPLSHH